MTDTQTRPDPHERGGPTPHNHTRYVDGCFRCDLSQHEERGGASVEKKTYHLGHVPGTVIVDKTELDHLRSEVERLQAELAECEQLLADAEQDLRGYQSRLDAAQADLAQARTERERFVQIDDE